MSARYGSHLEPPPRLPGETLLEWLEAIRVAEVLYPETRRIAPPTPSTAVPKGNSDRAARQFSAASLTPPKLATTHKPRTTSRKGRRCERCAAMFRVPVSAPDVTQCTACRTSPRPLETCIRCQKARVCRDGYCEYCARTLDKQAGRLWHPRHVSCCDCHGTTRPYYREGRCQPCFDAWDEARQYRQVAS